LNGILDNLLMEQGRNLARVCRSLMTGCVFGKSEALVKAASKMYGKHSVEELRDEGMIIETGTQVSEQLAQLAETGIHRVMLQWLDLDNLNGLEALAKAVL